MMLTQKGLDNIMSFKQTHLHRFREIGTFIETMQNHSNSHRKLTILGLFDILRQIN